MRGIQTTLRPFLNCTLQIAYFSLNAIMRFLWINRFNSLFYAWKYWINVIKNILQKILYLC